MGSLLCKTIKLLSPFQSWREDKLPHLSERKQDHLEQEGEGNLHHQPLLPQLTQGLGEGLIHQLREEQLIHQELEVKQHLQQAVDQRQGHPEEDHPQVLHKVVDPRVEDLLLAVEQLVPLWDVEGEAEVQQPPQLHL
jgi:hypothetical protein